MSTKLRMDASLDYTQVIFMKFEKELKIIEMRCKE